MRRRFYPQLAAVALILPAGGCVQSVRHSNTMLFGTNTSFGIKVGTAPNQVPSITVGYDRQEAVIMPLVANVADNGEFQTPCDMGSGVTTGSGSQFINHPCALVAINGKAQYSYSVLASFGAKFGGEGTTGGTKASGGLAQYFATGMAAQILALNGGASVVAVGEAAAKASEQKMDAADVKALFGNEQVVARGITYRTGYDTFQAALIAKISATNPGNLKARLDDFESKTVKEALSEDCPDPVACVATVKANDPYRNSYGPNAGKFDQALAAWATP